MIQLEPGHTSSNATQLFQIFNNNTEVDPESYKQLISIMMWFDTWYKEVKQNSLQSTISLKEHWKQYFIPRITYKDLKRTIRAFLGVIQYVQMHHPEIHIIPKTMCQDDVENLLFITTSQDIRGGNQPHYNFLSHLPPYKTELLLSSEMKDLQGNLGSYDLTALSNLVSLPLSKQKPSSGKNTTVFSEKEGWESFATKLDSDSVINDRW